MTTKDLEWRLTADPLNMERGFKSAEASARAMERELAKLEAQQRRVDDAMNRVGTGMVAGGLAIAAGLALAAKSAIDWESAWAGVTKVVDGSPEELAALEQQIRGLTAVLPQSHAEIAGVAAAAGQLGVKRQDIAEFTKTMIMMGTATNLASEDAAFQLARLMNIMQTAPQDVSRLGSAVVNLGNNFATTEAEIVAMALRISGAGHVINMSEADVLGYAAALSSVGIEAEAGGTAISKSFIIIEQAVRSGGDKLQAFASVAGMSADKFKQAYEQDAAKAIATFIAGLGRIQQSGGDLFGTLENLGMSEIRLRDSMLRLSGAGDVLTESLRISNQGWDENRALLDEANKRYETTAAKVQIARNSVNDLAIDIGNYLLPVVGGAAEAIQGLAEFFGDLPGPIQAGIVVLGVITAAVLLLGGTALLAIPRIAAFKAALETLANSTGRVATVAIGAQNALSRLGSFIGSNWIGIVGLAVTAVAAFATAQRRGRIDTDELTRTLDEQTGALTENTRVRIAHELESRGMLRLAQDLGLSLSDLTDAILEGRDVTDMMADAQRRSRDEFRNYVEDLDSNAYVYRDFIGQVNELHDALVQSQGEFERTGEAVHGAGDAIGQLDPQTQQLASTLGLSAVEAKDFNKELKVMDERLRVLLDTVFGTQNAEDALYTAMERLTEGVKRQREAGDANAGSFVGQSKAARENRDNLEEVARALADVTMRTLAQTGSAAEAMEAEARFREEMRNLAEQYGINIESVDSYNEAVAAIEREVQTRVDLEIAQALANIQKYKDWLRTIPPEVVTKLTTKSSKGGVQEHATGGWAFGDPGVDNIPAMLSHGEFVVTPNAAAQNAAVLQAINAGARIPLHGAGGGSGGSGGYTYAPSVTVNAASTSVGVQELQLVMAQQEARNRAGRPR